MKGNVCLVALMLAFSLMAAACGGGPGIGNESQPKIMSVSITPTNATVVIGGTQQFTASVVADGDIDRTVDWFVNGIMSGDEKVGTIDVSGLYTAPEKIPSSPITVKAVSRADPAKSATASVTLTIVAWVRFHNAGALSGFRSVVVGPSDEIVAGGFKHNAENTDSVGIGASYTSAGDLAFVLDYGQTVSHLRSVIKHPTEEIYFFAGRIGAGESASAYLAGVDSFGMIVSESYCQTTQNQGISVSAAVISDLTLHLGVERTAASNEPPRVITASMDGVLDCQSGFAVRDPGDRLSGLRVSRDHIFVSGDFRDTEGAFDVAAYVAKFALDGTRLWERTLDDVVSPKLLVAEEGGVNFVYLSGTQLNPTVEQSAVHEFLLVKMDADGNEVWRRTWAGDNPSPNQGNFANGIVAIPGGGAAVVGQINELNQPDLNQNDVGAIAYGPDGDVLWKLRHDFRGQSDVGNAGAFDSIGRFLVVGTTIRSGPDGDAFVAVFRVPLQ